MLHRINFAVYFMHLKLRKRWKEDYMKVGKAKRGLDYRIAKTVYS